jgi:hypothetical protein
MRHARVIRLTICLVSGGGLIELMKGREGMRRQNLIQAAMMTGLVAICGAAQADTFIFTPGIFHADLTGFSELGALNGQTGAILSKSTGTVPSLTR